MVMQRKHKNVDILIQIEKKIMLTCIVLGEYLVYWCFQLKLKWNYLILLVNCTSN